MAGRVVGGAAGTVAWAPITPGAAHLCGARRRFVNGAGFDGMANAPPCHERALDA